MAAMDSPRPLDCFLFDFYDMVESRESLLVANVCGGMNWWMRCCNNGESQK